MSQKKKTVLVIGPDYYNFMSAVSNAFAKFGYAAVSFPIQDYCFVPKVINKFGNKAIKELLKNKRIEVNSEEIKKIFDKCHPDLVFIMNADFISDEAVIYLKRYSKIVIWLFDNLSKIPHCQINLKNCDYLFSFDNNDVRTLREKGIDASFLPQACDTSLYYRMDLPKDIDILFVGNLYFYPNRQRLLRKVIEAFPDRKIRIVGEYKPWYKGIIKCIFREHRDIYLNHNVPPAEVNAYYNRSRVVLNIHREDQRDGANPRLFEICGSGAYQISDRNPYVESVFSDDEIGKYSTEQELVEQIQYGLTNDISAAASAAHSIVMQRHTFENRIRNVIAILDQGSASESDQTSF